MALTAPHDAAVVIAAKSVDAAMPKRASLPSMLPPAWSALAVWSTPSGVRSGLPACSCGATATTITTKISAIVASSAQPWRMSPTIRPKREAQAAGIRKIDSIWTKFESGVGFSNGCAELALKKPPPLVPSILIASCEATGPIAMDCVAALTSSITGWPLSVLQRLAVGAVFGCW